MNQEELFLTLQQASLANGVLTKLHTGKLDESDLTKLADICGEIESVIENNTTLDKQWLNLIRYSPLNTQKLIDGGKLPPADLTCRGIEMIRNCFRRCEERLDISETEDSSVKTIIGLLDAEDSFIVQFRIHNIICEEKAMELENALRKLKSYAEAETIPKSLALCLFFLPYSFYWNSLYLQEPEHRKSFNDVCRRVVEAIDYVLGHESHNNARFAY